jgi:hypothetical protein
MHRRLLSYGLVVLLTLIFAQFYNPLAAVQSLAQGGCQSFPETGKTVCGTFLTYWQQHGGLAQQGYPISGEFSEISDLNGQAYTVQYFERAVFEMHPENQPPNDVELSQLGTFRFKQKYPGGDPSGLPIPTSTPVPPPAPPTAVPNIRTQTIEFQGEGATFRGTVTNVKETKTIPPFSISKGGTARGKYVMVFMTVINTGTGSASTGLDGLKLRDTASRTFDQVSDFDIWYPAVKLNNTQIYNDNVQPGVPTPFLWLFDTPQEDTSYYLVAAGQ